MITARSAAAATILKIIRNKAFSNIVINNTLSDSGLSDKDRALCTRIVMTAAERARTMDMMITSMCQAEPEAMLRSLLYTGIAQILYMDKVPDAAACDETVKAAKILTDNRRAGFVNAVLRRVCRGKEKLLKDAEKAPDGLRYSLDGSVVNLIRKQYGDRADEIFESLFVRQPLCLRVNTMRTTADELVSRLNAAGCTASVTDGAVTVDSGVPEALSLINEGLFYIQGVSSQRAVDMLDAKPGMTVIDVCACPGGKSFGAAIDMNNTGRVIALDIHENKLPLITKAAEKLGISIIEASVHDGRETDTALSGKADRVICDVPCSALGVIPSKPEIRYKDVSDLTPLISTQYAILCASAEYLKVGGSLIYSTCTINRYENEEQTERFLSEHSGYTAGEQLSFLPDGLHDGFYARKITKIG